MTVEVPGTVRRSTSLLYADDLSRRSDGGRTVGDRHRVVLESEPGHHRVGFDRASVLECQLHAAVGTLIDADDAVSEMNGFGRHRAGERRMKVAAVAQQIGRAVARFRRFAEDHVKAHVAAVVFPVVPGARIKRTCAHQGLEAETA